MNMYIQGAYEAPCVCLLLACCILLVSPAWWDWGRNELLHDYGLGVHKSLLSIPIFKNSIILHCLFVITVLEEELFLVSAVFLLAVPLLKKLSKWHLVEIAPKWIN